MIKVKATHFERRETKVFNTLKKACEWLGIRYETAKDYYSRNKGIKEYIPNGKKAKLERLN